MTIVTTEQAQKLLDEAANRLGLLNLFDAAPDLAHSLIAVYEELAVMRVERDGILAANRGLVRLNERTEARAETAEAQLATANATITQMTAEWGEDAVMLEKALARADAAEALVKALREYFDAVEAFDDKPWKDDVVVMGQRVRDARAVVLAALAQQPPTASTEYERKVAQMKGDFPNGI